MNREVFYATIRRTLFGGKLSQSQVTGIEGILTAFDQVGDGDQDTLAYGLATAYHEVGKRMVPVREGFAKTDAGARAAVNKLARKRGPDSAVAKYAKPAGPYGHVYYARGHMGMTWLDNYQASSKDAGVDLVKNPDAMLDPVISARILIKGIMDGRWNGKGHGIDHYEGADEFLDDAEAAEARRTINVKDKATLIAGYHRKFYDALDLAGWAPTAKPVPRRVAETAPSETRPAPNVADTPSSATYPAPVKKPSSAPALGIGAVVLGVAYAARDKLAEWLDFITFWN